ncbi:hypothetical protein [Streptomyces sp. TP-A0356]|uniref:hypothetical protein n=1 Tax=Streptomyces sp. TP-A0356 TaxID=1359208 RepID=UPI0006E228B9|nr:hypothetical protein [Streptomyces sp. TP-A0356]
MRRFVLPIAAAVLLLTTACNNGKATPTVDGSVPIGKPAASKLDATSAFKQLSAAVPTAKLSGTVTADNDPNHLLGRPNQYTSKITFTDSRIKASDVQFTKPGDVDRGGAIEVFTDPTDAAARAKYIQAVTKSMPALAEYDYVHGTVLVRVSHYLTPAQAAAYKAAADGLS